MGNKNSRTRVHANQVNVEENESNDSFEIVWLDERSKQILLHDQYYSEQILSLKEYQLRFFEDVIECKDYLCKLPTNAQVMFLIEEQRAVDIVDAVHNLCPIKFIFIIHPVETDISHQNSSSSQYVKVKHINLNQLVDRIHYFKSRFLRSSKEFFSADIFKANQTSEDSSSKINGRFLFTQLLLDILLRMEQKLNDKDELIVQCTALFTNNPKELKKVQDFHLEYKQEKVFEWYTKDSFIYRQLNKAFRTQNIDLLFLYRFFLQDLQTQLALHQVQSPICVYRGQILPKKEWDELSNAVGQYISMHSVLSTSLKMEVAKIYIPENNINVAEANEVPVIFQIEANPHLPGDIKPFANIAFDSQFPEENEILFMAGSIFRIIEIMNENSFVRVRMELCSSNDNNLKTLFETLRREYGGELAGYENEASLNSFGIVLYNIGKLDIADRFFRRIYYETSINDPNRIRYCLNIGNAALHSGRYEECARWYDRAFQLCAVNGLVDRPLVGTLHLTRGNLYTKLNKRKQALESYNKALTIFRTNFGEYHPLMARCYCCLANHFERRKYYSMSLDFHEKALEIAERTLPEMHPDLALYHLTLSKFFIKLKHQNLQAALHHAQTALEIANRVLPSDHKQLLNIYLLLSEIHSLLENFQQSIIWFDKAEAFDGLQSTDVHVRRTLARRKMFICKRCHRLVWIYRYFEWMKDTRLNCLIFHIIPFFFLDIKRYCCNY